MKIKRSTFFAAAMATFAFGYLQALTSQAGSQYGLNHPMWALLAFAVIAISIALESSDV